MPLPTYLTIKQAAEMFQVSTKTIRRRVASREWPHVRVGRQIRLDLDVITGKVGPGFRYRKP